MKLLIVGAGGHGQVVADAVRASGQHVVAYLDEDTKLHGSVLGGVRVAGGDLERCRLAHDGIVVAVGDNRTRQAVYEKFVAEGERLITVRHSASIVAPTAVVGDGTMILAGAVVNPEALIGANVILNTMCCVEHHCVIGDHVHIAPGVRLGGAVQVGDGALVGIGAVVLPGVRIGRDAIVGGGAVVIADVADRAVVVGNPARSRA